MSNDDPVSRTQGTKLSDRLRAMASELDRLDPCSWDEAWSRTCAALRRGNAEWAASGRAPIECMEAELARLYDIEKKCAEVEQLLRYYKQKEGT